MIRLPNRRITLSVPSESFTYRAFSKIDAADVDALLRNFDWSWYDSSAPDLTDMLTQLSNNLKYTIDTLAP